eukprot:snap_masked-scaffold_3-processed-gene-13.31-mRNA-1 protein AED:1.00 eAED:1.00 QI:0/0/0/0/1/1/2/0/271
MNFLVKSLKASRVETSVLALFSILLGNAQFYHQTKLFNPPIMILSSLTAISLQLLCNICNDFGDFISGADEQNKIIKVGKDASFLQRQTMTKVEAVKSIYFFTSSSLLFGLLLLYLTNLFNNENFQLLLIFTSLGIASIFSAIYYTIGFSVGKVNLKPYGYIGLGDLAVFVFFGLVGVSGSFSLLSLSFPSSSTIYLSVYYGLLVVGVLNVNNIRDYFPDKKVGKNTIVVYLGQENAVYYHGGLMFGSLVFDFLHFKRKCFLYGVVEQFYI